MPQRKVRTTKKLLSGGAGPAAHDQQQDDEEEDAKTPQPIVSYYHPNVSVEIVCDSGKLPYHSLPPAVKSHIQLAQQRPNDEEWYLPPVFVNDFWLLKGVSSLSRSIPRGLYGLISISGGHGRLVAHEPDQHHDNDAPAPRHGQTHIALQVPAVCIDARLVREASFGSRWWARRCDRRRRRRK